MSGVPDIETTLEMLSSQQLIRKKAGNTHWVFNNPLIEKVVYESLQDDTRNAFHCTAAELLEKYWQDAKSNHADVLAHHLTPADQNMKALSTLIKAGEKAAGQSRYEKAVRYFEQALHILSMVPQASELIRWRLAVGLGDFYRDIGKYNESIAALLTCIGILGTGCLDQTKRAGLFQRIGDTTRKKVKYGNADSYFKAAALIIDEPKTAEQHKELARIFTGLAWSQFHQGLFETARETSERGLLSAKAAKSIVDTATLENLLGGIYYSQSDWAAAFYHTQRAMELRKQIGQTRELASTLGNLGVLAILAGDWDKTRSFFDQSLGMRDELDTEGLSLLHNHLGILNRDQGHLAQAERHFRDSLLASTSIKHAYHAANATLGLASVFLLKEDTGNAHMALSQAIQIAEEIGAADVITEARRVEVEMLITEGKLEPACKTAQKSLEHTQETHNRNHQVSLCG